MKTTRKITPNYFGEEADPLRPENPVSEAKPDVDPPEAKSCPEEPVVVPDAHQGPRVTQDAPVYWLDEGGAHWTVEASCGARCSAIRVCREQPWNVYDCQGILSVADAYESNAAVVERLAELLRSGLRTALGELEGRP